MENENFELENIGFEESNVFLLKNKNAGKWICGIGDREVELEVIIQCEPLELWGSDNKENNGFEYEQMVTVSVMPSWDKEISTKFKQELADDNQIDLDQVSLMDLEGYCGFGALIPIKAIDGDKIDDSFIWGSYCPFFIREGEDEIEMIKKVVYPRINAVMGMIGFFLDVQSRGCGTTNWDEIEYFLGGKNPIDAGFERIGILN